MKKTILAVFSIGALMAAGAIASGEPCRSSARSGGCVYHPLADIGLTFDGEVAVDASATVLSENRLWPQASYQHQTTQERTGRRTSRGDFR